MIQLFRNYLKLRIRLSYFLLVAIWIFLFSVPVMTIDVFSFFDIVKIVLVLITMRLYDDVVQSENDSLVKLKLPLVILICVCALSWINAGIELSMFWIYFFMLNHVFYKALGHRRFWAFVLPAFQFPIVSIALNYRLWDGVIDLIYLVSAVSIFLSAIVYRWLEHSEDRRHPIWIYFFSSIVVAIAILNFSSALSFAAGVGAFLCLVVLFLFGKQKTHLWWALIVLLMQIAAFNLEV